MVSVVTWNILSTLLQFIGICLAIFWGMVMVLLILGFNKNRRANSRSYDLLLQWLNPAQKRQWKSKKMFSVRGRSGRFYVISRPAPFNIMILDSNKTYLGRMCIEPEGGLAGGDVLLAQKIMLETNEVGAYKIANLG